MRTLTCDYRCPAILIAGLSAVLFLLGCSSTSSNPGGTSATPCAAGNTRECVGIGACRGGQRCATDGTWSDCLCSLAQGGSGGGSAKDSGVPGSGGASVLRDAQASDSSRGGSSPIPDGSNTIDAASRDGGKGGAPRIPCTHDSDCAATGQVCNIILGECAECVVNECRTGEWCAQFRCRPQVTCTSNADCKNADGQPFCRTDWGQCVECAKDQDCPSGACWLSACTCGHLDTDPNNCGACGAYCADGCDLAKCKPTYQPTVLYPGDFPDCNAYCATLGGTCSEQCRYLTGPGSGAQSVYRGSLDGFYVCTDPIQSVSAECCCRFPPVLRP